MTAPARAPQPVFGGVDFYASAIAQADRLKAINQNLLADLQHASETWLARRQETADACLELSRDAVVFGGGPELVSAWARWMRGSMQRLSQDMNEQIELGGKAALYWSRVQASPRLAKARSSQAPAARPPNAPKRRHKASNGDARL